MVRAALTLLLFAPLLPAASASVQNGTLKKESFDHDPGWESYNNRPEVAAGKSIEQKFGYSATNFAGKAAGEIGGRVQRSTLPASYAEAISTKTLNDKLAASGTFAVTDKEGSNGSLLFGWFNSAQPGGGRPIGSLGLNIGYSRQGGHLHLRLINDTNQSCGMPITPWPKPKPRGPESAIRFPLRRDGTHYTWKLDYDPKGAGGNGQVHFTIKSNLATHDEYEGKDYALDLPEGFKMQGATFDRFGIINLMKTGGAMNIYFDDIMHDGKSESFASDPHWIGSGNQGVFIEANSAGTQDFGFSAKTNYAGGKPGEIGGIFWRNQKEGSYYACTVSSLSLETPLEAHGIVRLIVGAPDSGLRFGWFNSADRNTTSGVKESNFLGVSIAGPTRIGHYFGPYCISATGTAQKTATAPVIAVGKTYKWSISYDPKAADGHGVIRVSLGNTSGTLPLKPSIRSEGATFDRFGFLTIGHGGQMVKLFIDDLEITDKPDSSPPPK